MSRSEGCSEVLGLRCYVYWKRLMGRAEVCAACDEVGYSMRRDVDGH